MALRPYSTFWTRSRAISCWPTTPCLTTIRILEKKGYVAHAKDGRAHVYMPLVERADATRSEVRHLVQRLFRDSHELLVLNILEDSGLNADELQRLKQYLKERE